MRRVIVLVAALGMGVFLWGCSQHLPDPGEAGGEPGRTESEQEEPAEEDDGMEDEAPGALPVGYDIAEHVACEVHVLESAGEGWSGGYLSWVSDAELLVLFGNGGVGNRLILFDAVTQSERVLFENIGAQAICYDDTELIVRDFDRLLEIAWEDLSATERTENLGRDWGADTVGGLSADRDDDGIVIRYRDGSRPDIRVATVTEDSFFDVPVWSPNGQLLKYGRYTVADRYPVHIDVSGRAGVFLYEIETPDRACEDYWSTDSGTILVAVHDDRAGYEEFRIYDALHGSLVAACDNPFPGAATAICSVHQTRVAGWRALDEDWDTLAVFVLDVGTGESRDLLTIYTDHTVMPRFCLSPDGRRLAMVYTDGQIVIVNIE